MGCVPCGRTRKMVFPDGVVQVPSSRGGFSDPPFDATIDSCPHVRPMSGRRYQSGSKDMDPSASTAERAADYPGAAFMFSVGSHNLEDLKHGTSAPSAGLQTYLRASSLLWTGAGPNLT